MIATMITANRLFEVSDFSFAISTVFSKKIATLLPRDKPIVHEYLFKLSN